jgi:hypothetical protein
MKMKFYIQYDLDTGSIHGTNGPHNLPAPPILEGTGHLVLDIEQNQIPPDLRGKRVNVVMRILEDDPVFARNQARQEILSQLVDLDAKRPRAMTDILLNGDETALQAIEDRASPLREQLAKLPPL